MSAPTSVIHSDRRQRHPHAEAVSRRTRDRVGEDAKRTVRAPTAAAWPEDILRQLDYDRMADQVVSASIPFEKTVHPLWVAIAVRIEDFLPDSTVYVDLFGGQHGNPTTGRSTKPCSL